MPLLSEAPSPGFTTRFAPAPTGFLHLGHVASALAVFGVAEAFGGRVLLRVENHDRIRCRPEFETALLEDLEWLGFSSEFPVVRQSDRENKYEEALRRLAAAGLVYSCRCSRSTIEAALGPSNGELRYPGTCRNRGTGGEEEKARRILLDPMVVAFHDLRLGRIEQSPAEQAGDTLARDRTGQWTYQFAVTVDDFDQGVDLVIRGEDLLTSTGRQIQIAQLLGRQTPPRFLHHPLIKTPEGRKLSKSSRDTGIRELRAAGWSVERVLGEAAASLGLSKGQPVSHAEVAARLKASAAV